MRHAGNGKRTGFGDLAIRAAQLPVPDDVRPKDPGQYKLIGPGGRLRVDSPGKILGQTRYTIDVTLPGMLTAVVLHPPKFGATPASVDDSAALAEPGVTAVIPIEEGIAVVGETFDDAQRGLRALVVDWDDSNAERRSSEELLAEHRRLVESGEQAVVAREDGDVEAALAERGARGGRVLRAALPRARPDGAEQRRVPDGRRRHPRGLGRHRGTHLRADGGLGGRRDQRGPGPGARPVRRRVVRPAQHLRTRSGQRGRAGRAGAGLEVPVKVQSLREEELKSAGTGRWPCTGSAQAPTPRAA